MLLYALPLSRSGRPLSVSTLVNGQNAKPVEASLCPTWMWEMQQAAGSGCCLAMLLPLVIYVRAWQFDDAFAQPGSPASWLLHRAERISNS
jgi:hypothetical protein